MMAPAPVARNVVDWETPSSTRPPGRTPEHVSHALTGT